MFTDRMQSKAWKMLMPWAHLLPSWEQAHTPPPSISFMGPSLSTLCENQTVILIDACDGYAGDFSGVFFFSFVVVLVLVLRRSLTLQPRLSLKSAGMTEMSQHTWACSRYLKFVPPDPVLASPHSIPGSRCRSLWSAWMGPTHWPPFWIQPRMALTEETKTIELVF